MYNEQYQKEEEEHWANEVLGLLVRMLIFIIMMITFSMGAAIASVVFMRAVRWLGGWS